jgi:hypothetical protein
VDFILRRLQLVGGRRGIGLRRFPVCEFAAAFAIEKQRRCQFWKNREF